MIGRSQEEKLIKIALIASEHALLVGVPGTGKTYLAKLIAEASNLSAWEFLFGKFSTPEDFFGQIMMSSLLADECVRNLKGRACDFDVVIADEIYKAGNSILLSLLTMMNERQFNNPERIDIPLRTMIGLSNELPSGEDKETLSALHDRFMLRTIVNPLEDEYWMDLLDYSGTSTIAPVDLDVDLDLDISFPDELKRELCTLRMKLRDEKSTTITDRRFRKSLKMVKAHAAYCGRSTATESDFDVLRWCWWEDPSEFRGISAFIAAEANPEAAEIEALIDAATSLVKDTTTDNYVDDSARINAHSSAISQLRDITDRLVQLGADQGEVDKIGRKKRQISEVIARKFGIPMNSGD